MSTTGSPVANPHTNSTNEEEILRVKGSSNPQSLASAIAHACYDNKRVTLRAIGAGAVNQAVKACAIARGFVAPRGVDLLVIPGFETVMMNKRESSAQTDNGEPREKEEMSAIILRVLVA